MRKARKIKKKLVKKTKGCPGCAKRRAMLRESSLYQFIKAITEKKYNQANKYLADVIEAKLKSRIAANL
jgi:hypothetical protein